ncbi:hypothetical protein LCGC14_1034560 [marine sediment metagenome]|uniref:Uncharacterized protein n=1 Tax=marine sediment metagenome TaxID=412755 RepID=A0A0F9QZN4_9ZZZZ
MISQKLDEISDEVMVNLQKVIIVREVDISQLIIPFSKVFKTFKQRDIYSGNEKMTFNERDYKFKMILRQEFSAF